MLTSVNFAELSTQSTDPAENPPQHFSTPGERRQRPLFKLFLVGIL